MEIFMTYILPVLILSAIAALAGVLLTVCSKIFFVETDETVSKIMEILPQANCGACGYSGCEGYANAIAKGVAATNLCKPGGTDAASGISAVMGTEALVVEREVAFVRCNGNCDATKPRYTYIGTPTCAAAERFYNGVGTCQSGCDGFGDCVKVCDKNAISIINGVAVINASKCAACGKCVKVCPNNLIVVRKMSQLIDVRCSSKDPGKITRQVCKNGCIGCKICEKKCPNEAIKVVDNHAVIDYDKCNQCGACMAACPQKCIIKLVECQ